MNILHYAGITLLGAWIFWALYVFTMGIYRAKLDKRLKGLNYVLALPVVLLGLVVDVFSNLVVAPLLFLEVPREWLVTIRLQRYMRRPCAKWRRDIATYICDQVLDPFDPQQDHC